MISLRNTLMALTIATFAVAVAAVATIAFAANSATTRYALCGPSGLDAANTWCREGAALMQAAMLEAGIAIALGLVTLWLVRRRGERRAAAAQLA